jgi:hypothetical protein
MKVSRRYFMYGALLAGAIPRGGFGSVVSLKALGYQSPNDKLNIAGIGVGGRGGSDLAGVASETIVALADVDANALAAGKQRYPNATTFNDFRQMLDKQAKGIDAVTIGTPDHMHGIAALSAMQLGKHVYVEKPLVRTPWEARILTQAAAKYKVATQMGNQGYSHEATRMASEIFWSGEIGEVREVHAWRGRASWPQGAAMQKIPPPEPVPPTLNWDAWLGPAELLLPAVQLARALRLRHGRSHRRLGHSHPRAGQHGVAPWRADDRRVREAGRHEPVCHPRQDAYPLGFPRARQHAAGGRALVCRLSRAEYD